MHDCYFEDIQLHQPRTTDTFIVPEEELIAFAKRWDPLAIAAGREAAKGSPHAGLIAPATYLMAIANALISQLDPRALFIGVADWRVQFPHPVRPGDRLVATSECVYKRESRTKTDRGIARFVITVQNQNGEAALHWECTVLVLKRNHGK
jgi:acyl dehydratase